MQELLQTGTLTNSGPLIIHICELDAELSMGICLTRDDITQMEFLGLMILREERDRHIENQRRRQQAVEERNRRRAPESFG